MFVGTGDLLHIADAVEALAAATAGYRARSTSLPAASWRTRGRARGGPPTRVSEGCDHTRSLHHPQDPRPPREPAHGRRAGGGCGAAADGGSSQPDRAGPDRLRPRPVWHLARHAAGALAVRVPAVRRPPSRYPASVTDELLEVTTEPAVCKYLTCRFSHRRRHAARHAAGAEGAAIRRSRASGCRARIALRSSFIVGFPGETEDDAGAPGFPRGSGVRARGGVHLFPGGEHEAATCRPGRRGSEAERRARVMAAGPRRGAPGAAQAANRRGVGRDARGGALVGRTRTQAPEIDGVNRPPAVAAPGAIVAAVVTKPTISGVRYVRSLHLPLPEHKFPPLGGGDRMRKTFLKKALRNPAGNARPAAA